MTKIYIPPFTEIIYKDKKVKEKYSLTIMLASALLDSIEIELVKRDFRCLTTYSLEPQIMQIQLTHFSKEGLTFYPIKYVKKYSGFAHFFEEPSSVEDSLIFGVLTKNVEYAKKFKEAFFKGDHYTQGKLLGYPECCINSFIDGWNQGYFDLIPYIALKGTEIDPRLNVMLRYIGVRIIPFFPCSFTCNQAIKFADYVIEIIDEINYDLRKSILEMLSLPLTWSQVNGIIEVIVNNEIRIIAGGFSDDEFKFEFKCKTNL
jgi:hypothetical protein